MSKRKVTLHATRGKTRTSLETSASTWGELKAEIEASDEFDLDLNKMKAIERSSRHTLEHSNSALPIKDFSVVLLPMQTKSGAAVLSINLSTAGYWDLREEIKRIVDENEAAKPFFNQGRNYTNKSTSILRNLLRNWLESTTQSHASAHEPLEESQTSGLNTSKRTELSELEDIISRYNISEEDAIRIFNLSEKQIAEIFGEKITLSEYNELINDLNPYLYYNPEMI